MSQRTRSDSPDKFCTTADCNRPLRAKGLCFYHYRKANPPKKNASVECPTCGTMTMKRDKARRFCSLECRDAWRCDQPSDPMWTRSMKCQLPADHMVMVLIRRDQMQAGIARNQAAKSAHRKAFERGDWLGLIRILESMCVKVDECWLWSRNHDGGYGKIQVGKKSWSAHRLMAHAANGGKLDPTMAVHHACAEGLCINPLHLQVIEPHLNNAEMVERTAYKRRIAQLEDALRKADPWHPLIRTVQSA